MCVIIEVQLQNTIVFKRSSPKLSADCADYKQNWVRLTAIQLWTQKEFNHLQIPWQYYLKLHLYLI